MARSISGRKAQEWQRRFAKFQESPQSVVTFCRQEGVSPQSFYLWRRRLAAAHDCRVSAAKPPRGFRAVQLLAAAGVSVQLPGGTQLLVPTSDVEGLRVVIETLVRADAQREGGARSC